MTKGSSTRFAGLPRPLALAVMAAAVLAIAVLLVVALQPIGPSTGGTATGGGDADMYAAIIARMRQGQGYYAAAHTELLANGYGTRSVFNWRTPFYPTLLSWFPNRMLAQGTLGALALLAAAVTVTALKPRNREALIWLAGLLLLSLVAALAPGTIYFSEIAAGLLILLSVSAYRFGRWSAGLAAGLAALFVRELAGLYVVVALLLAVRRERWPEVAAWGLGLVAYAAYFLWHASQVAAQLGPVDPAYPEGWLQFGGLGFVLRTAQVDGALFTLPLWVTAIVLPLALLGLAAAGRLRVWLTVAGYLVAFAIIGKPLDTYWGAVYTPLLAFGLAALPAALRDLMVAVRRSPRS